MAKTNKKKKPKISYKLSKYVPIQQGTYNLLIAKSLVNPDSEEIRIRFMICDGEYENEFFWITYPFNSFEFIQLCRNTLKTKYSEEILEDKKKLSKRFLGKLLRVDVDIEIGDPLEGTKTKNVITRYLPWETKRKWKVIKE